MDDSASLEYEARTRLEYVAARLDSALRDPAVAASLSELNRHRLVADASQTAQSVRDALQRMDYPTPMRRELIYRLIQQFENSVLDALERGVSPLGPTPAAGVSGWERAVAGDPATRMLPGADEPWAAVLNTPTLTDPHTRTGPWPTDAPGPQQTARTDQWPTWVPGTQPTVSYERSRPANTVPLAIPVPEIGSYPPAASPTVSHYVSRVAGLLVVLITLAVVVSLLVLRP